MGGPFSMELCGGTHVGSSAQVGPVTLLGESSVGSGVRRVEAYVGLDSYRYLAKERALMAGLASSLKVPSDQVPGRVESLVTKLKEAEKQIEKMRADVAKASVGSLIDDATRVGDVLVVAGKLDGMDAGDLRTLAADLRGRVGSDNAVVALFSASGDKVPFAVATTAAARDAGIKAGDLVRDLAPLVSGRGGGKPDLAQGSGSDAAGIDSALVRLRELVGSAR
jgi:alanyl-tRNA synthetase